MLNKKVAINLTKRALPDYCPSNVQKICSNTQSKELIKHFNILIQNFGGTRFWQNGSHQKLADS